MLWKPSELIKKILTWFLGQNIHLATLSLLEIGEAGTTGVEIFTYELCFLLALDYVYSKYEN
jgi:hypothetical protein